jgi:hypothetical protein
VCWILLAGLVGTAWGGECCVEGGASLLMMMMQL